VNSRAMLPTAAFSALVAVFATTSSYNASPTLVACQGISAERASRLNDKFRGNGTLTPDDGEVTIQTPCGAVGCRAGRGFARPKDSRVDGPQIATP
jgi:hypothetical protein